MPGVFDVVRNVAASVSRFVQEVRQPPPPPPSVPQDSQAQQDYQRDVFEQRQAAVVDLAGGVVNAFLPGLGLPTEPPPISGGPSPISSTEGLELLQNEPPYSYDGGPGQQPLANLQHFLVDAGYLPQPTEFGAYFGAADSNANTTTTGDALMRFQLDSGITVDVGRLTPANFAATMEALRNPRPAPAPRFQELAAQYSEELGRPRGPAVQTPFGLRQDFDNGYILRDRGRVTHFRSYDGTDLVAPIRPPPDPVIPEGSAASLTPRYQQGGDTPWANRYLGQTGDVPPELQGNWDQRSIRNRGCAVTTSAMGISAALAWMQQNGQSPSVQGPVDPGMLDGTLETTPYGYTDDAIGWGAAAQAYGLELDQVHFDRDALNLRLAQEPHFPVILQVDVHNANFDNHYLIITGTRTDPATGETIYLAHDPATRDPNATGTDPNDPNNANQSRIIELRFNANDELVGGAQYGDPPVTYSAGADGYMTRYVPPGYDKDPAD